MTNLVLFGVTGDLARQKLIASLGRLWSSGEISSEISDSVYAEHRFYGFGRKHFSKEEFEDFIVANSKFVASGFAGTAAQIHLAKQFAEQWTYIESDLDKKDGYVQLKKILNDASKGSGNAAATSKEGGLTSNVIFYISLPPVFTMLAIEMLLSAGVIKRGDGKRIAIEKPFGSDSASAKKLNAFLLKNLDEAQIFRIDHYAGKHELLLLEESAKLGVLGPLFNSKMISRIEVSLSEQKKVGTRGLFYDSVGALNDICQNHLLHMLGTVLAVPYLSSLSKDEFAALRAKFIESVKPVGKPFLGQYESFLKEEGVKSGSKTETYFNIENKLDLTGEFAKRWRGVKVILKGGKGLSMDEAGISLFLKGKSGGRQTNSINIYFARQGTGEAYDFIFKSLYNGDKSHFADMKQILAGWKYVEKVKTMKNIFKIYKDGAKLT